MVRIKSRVGLSGIGASGLGGLGAFLHTNKVSSCILIWIRFTNERQSSTMKTINLPKLARKP